ncbi:MAG: glycosyltransferase [Gemmatimonadota bacterium]|nr:glycosyltransferase [Gemmatimonadota bacterium]
MKVLIIGSDDTWKMERSVQRALRRAGHKTRLIDDRRVMGLIGRGIAQRWVLARARRFKPDFIVLSTCPGLTVETVQTILADTPNAMWYLQPQWHRATYRPDIKHIVQVGKLAQTFFVTGFEAEWKALGLAAKFLPGAGDRDIRPVPHQATFHSDVSFIGTGYDPSRAHFLLKVGQKYDLKVWGDGWEKWRKELRGINLRVVGKEFAAICSSSSISLGINPDRAKAAGNYTSARTWMTILAGGFYLGQGGPGLTEMLREGDHCAWYHDLDSCMKKIRYYLENSAARERIKREGQVFVRQHHTYDQRIRFLLSGESYVNPIG